MLFIFSFFMRQKTVSVVKESDEIMINIRNNYTKYKTDSTDAFINKNTIIPGISGRKVNINKSYKAMREYGKYNDDLYIYDYLKPNISISNHKDKVIVNGNRSFRKVSLIIDLKDESNINKTISLLDDNDTKVSFFVTDNWLLNNNSLVSELTSKGYIFGINELMDYQSSDVKWMDTIIKKVAKQKDGYCLYKDKKSVLNCKSLNNYTVKPIVISNNYLLSIQDSISNGNIFLINYSKLLDRELLSIIRYINSKGYDIVTLNELLKE